MRKREVALKAIRCTLVTDSISGRDVETTLVVRKQQLVVRYLLIFSIFVSKAIIMCRIYVKEQRDVNGSTGTISHSAG